MNESPDLWVMFRPAQVFSHLLKDRADGRWIALRRPLLLILTLATFASLATSGRLSLRLLTAGAECAAFLDSWVIERWYHMNLPPRVRGRQSRRL